MLVIDPRSTWTYVLEADKDLPVDEQTEWTLGHLSLADEATLIDGYLRDPMTGLMVRQAIGSEHLRVIRRGLRGWRKFRVRRDGNVQEVPFETGPLGGPKDELLALIPLLAREELARAIEAETLQREEERKKSSLPSTPGTAAI